MLFSILYVILRGLLRLVPSADDGRDRDIELLAGIGAVAAPGEHTPTISNGEGVHSNAGTGPTATDWVACRAVNHGRSSSRARLREGSSPVKE